MIDELFDRGILRMVKVISEGWRLVL